MFMSARQSAPPVSHSVGLLFRLQGDGNSIKKRWIILVLVYLLVGCSPRFAPMIMDAHGVKMVLIPAGKFTMGSDNGSVDQQPAHVVYLDAYYIDKYEVTNALYRDCVEAGICSLPESTYVYDQNRFANYPVDLVNWYMADSYCKWRDAHLPTEAEWEKAARGTDGRTYPWGNEFNGEYANYCDINCTDMGNKYFNDGFGNEAPVGSFIQGVSPYGVFDMAGNAAEWVSDWKDPFYYRSSPYKNPPGPETGSTRVVRGGSFWDPDTSLIVTSRNSHSPFEYFPGLGFRCAINAMNENK